MPDLAKTFQGLLVALLTLGILVVVLNQFFGIIAVTSGDIEVDPVSNTSGQYGLYDAGNDSLVTNVTYDGSTDTYTYSDIEHGTYYINDTSTTDSKSDNFTHNASITTRIEYDVTAGTTTVTEYVNEELDGTVDKVIDGTSQVVDFGIILIIVGIAGQMIAYVSRQYR